jgi:hypothetical protein
VSFYVSTATFFLLHCDEWDRVVAPPRHKFVTGATLLQLTRHEHCSLTIFKRKSWWWCFVIVQIYRSFSITGNYERRSFYKYGFLTTSWCKHSNRNYSAILATLLLQLTRHEHCSLTIFKRKSWWWCFVICKLPLQNSFHQKQHLRDTKNQLLSASRSHSSQWSKKKVAVET